MSRILSLIVLLTAFLYAKDTALFKKKNTLYVQNLIEIEENIAKQYENYLLNEFSLPTLSNLITDDYLGSNFSTRNLMGSLIDFKAKDELKIKFAVSKKYDSYVYSLYRRDLYRDRTSAVVVAHTQAYGTGGIIPKDSYISFELETQEAKNIYDLLKKGAVIYKDCKGVKANRYCNKNQQTLRWYDSSFNWIEYDKKDLNLGNVTINDLSLIDVCKTNSNCKLNDLAVGSYIYIENGDKYIKTIDNIKEVN